MAEKTIAELQVYPTKNMLWRALPRQMQYPSFKAVLDYLEESNKIIYDKDGTIVLLTRDNSELRKFVKLR